MKKILIVLVILISILSGVMIGFAVKPDKKIPGEKTNTTNIEERNDVKEDNPEDEKIIEKETEESTDFNYVKPCSKCGVDIHKDNGYDVCIPCYKDILTQNDYQEITWSDVYNIEQFQKVQMDVTIVERTLSCTNGSPVLKSINGKYYRLIEVEGNDYYIWIHAVESNDLPIGSKLKIKGTNLGTFDLEEYVTDLGYGCDCPVIFVEEFEVIN